MSERELPRGIEVLVKKAAVDAGFRAALLEKRAEAAKDIELDLDPAEEAMLDGVPAAQLEAIVSSTRVDEKLRPAFLGKAAAVMIAALGAGGVGCGPDFPELERLGGVKGHSAYRIESLHVLLEKEKKAVAESEDAGLHEKRIRHLEALIEKEKRRFLAEHERARRAAERRRAREGVKE